MVNTATPSSATCISVAAVCLRGVSLAVGWVGDCRVYRRRSGRLELLTDDHVWRNPYSHPEPRGGRAGPPTTTPALLEAIGRGNVRPEVSGYIAEPNDLLVLTAGVHRLMSDREIEQVLAGEGWDPARGAAGLAAAASGRDPETGTAALVLVATPSGSAPGPEAAS